MREVFFIYPMRSIIGKRLIIKAMFFALLLIIFFTTIVGFNTWYVEIKAIEARFNEIQKSYLDVIRKTLWVDDRENLNVILL